MNAALIEHCEAIERAGTDMLSAARHGDWDQVLKLERAHAVLISQLRHAACAQTLDAEASRLKSRLMQRVLVNDAEIRHLAEPWLDDLDGLPAGPPRPIR